jgi:hypothetical protein
VKSRKPVAKTKTTVAAKATSTKTASTAGAKSSSVPR